MTDRQEVRPELLKRWRLESENAPGNYLGFAPCEIKWDRWCRGRVTDGHEIILRSRGGSTLDRKNVLLTCRYCHDQVHAHPDIATERGFMASKPIPQSDSVG